jgi:type I restriction enzyme S subunit
MREGWVETTLGHIATFDRGISYRSEDLEEPEIGRPFLNLKSMDRGGGFRPDGIKWYSGPVKPNQLTRSGELLVCCTDLTKEKAILGYPLLVPESLSGDQPCYSLDLMKVTVNELRAMKEFIFLMLQGASARDFMRSHSSGTTVMHLKVKEVPNFIFALPPLAEQRRIVDVIESVDNYITALETRAETARTARSALLHDFLSNPGPDWTKKPLGEVSRSRLGKMLNKSMKTGVSEYPYVRNSDVQWDFINTAELNTMYFSENDRDEFDLLAGDVLICEGGEVGRTAVVENDLERIFFQKAIHRVRCGSELFPRFLMHFMRFAADTGRLADYSSAQTISHLTGEKLRLLPIDLPSIEFQEEIVDSLDAITRTEKKLNGLASKVQNLRAALLSDLLSGNHEIPTSYDQLLGAA